MKYPSRRIPFNLRPGHGSWARIKETGMPSDSPSSSCFQHFGYEAFDVDRIVPP